MAGTVSKTAKKGGARKSRPQQVRIIGGQWKRSLLPVSDVAGLRPTPDRVRETVFNWINHQLGGDWARASCLDLFAGTGALGFEAASRGAAHTVLVEWSPMAVRQLREIKEKLRADAVEVMQGDALGIAQRMASRGQQVDVIFLDPPYRQAWLPRILPLCEPLLKENGIVYAESEEPLALDRAAEIPDWLKKWDVIRQDRAGAVFYYLLKLAS
jgi:16S rRNA (guanine(966)-N(2))-methyltransferase RsmD